jgi:hypothetical protein
MMVLLWRNPIYTFSSKGDSFLKNQIACPPSYTTKKILRDFYTPLNIWVKLGFKIYSDSFGWCRASSTFCHIHLQCSESLFLDISWSHCHLEDWPMSDRIFSSQMGLVSKSPKEEQVHSSYMCEYEYVGVWGALCKYNNAMLSTPVWDFLTHLGYSAWVWGQV